MKKPLPDASPFGLLPKGEGELSNEDLFSLLAGLRPGWYNVAGLWPRYLVWAENEGREPVKPISLGMNLRRIAAETKKARRGLGGNVYLFNSEHVTEGLRGEQVTEPLSTDPVG